MCTCRAPHDFVRRLAMAKDGPKISAEPMHSSRHERVAATAQLAACADVAVGHCRAMVSTAGEAGQESLTQKEAKRQ